MTMYQGCKGNRGVKVQMRKLQIPKIGDKFSSRHGQKGTIGMIYPGTDLPWTMSGMNPDIIINPCAIPSRMTIAHMLETLTGKAVALSGKDIDASAFNGLSVETIADIVKAHGFQKYGNETFYSGTTGGTTAIPCVLWANFLSKIETHGGPKISCPPTRKKRMR